MPNFLDIAANVVTVPKDGYGSETALNVGPGSLFYKAGSTVSSGSNDGTLTSGSSLTLTGPTSFVAVSQGARLVVSDPQFDEAASLAASVGQPGGVARAGTYGLLANQPTVTAAGDQGTYFATDDNGGTLYQVQSGAWVKVAPRGVELGYAQITSPYSGTTTGGQDVPGLSVTVQVGSRPIIVEFGCYGLNNTVAAQSFTAIQEGSTVIGQAQVAAAANTTFPVLVRGRVAPAAGAHTYKVTVYASSGGTTSINAGATSPAWIQVTEV